MRIPLDPESSMPLYRQIEQYLTEQITSGGLKPGARLPSSRALASSLGVSRIVVTNAYAELESQGLVTCQHGSGTFVSEWEPSTPPKVCSFLSEQDWPIWQQDLLSAGWRPAYQEIARMLSSVPHPNPISLAERIRPSALWPVEDFRKTMRKVLSEDGPGALGIYEDFHEAGYMPLRESVSEILASQGIPARPQNIMITAGSAQALNLAARVLLRPGDVVLVESPTYNVAIDLFRSQGARLLGVPVDEDGMQVDQVESLVQATRPRLIFTLPTFHNPTGTCMSGSRRRELIALAQQYSIPIVEDDYVGNIRFEGKAEPALKAIDPGGLVIYAGSFSKVLMPGLRLGYVVADGPVFERLRGYKYVADLATPQLLQRVLHESISVGRYHAHLQRVTLKRRCRTG